VKVTIAKATPVKWEIELSCGHAFTGAYDGDYVEQWELEKLEKEGWDCFYCNPPETLDDKIVKAEKRKAEAEKEVERLKEEQRQKNMCWVRVDKATLHQGDPQEGEAKT
jgi:hypothetical protein